MSQVQQRSVNRVLVIGAQGVLGRILVEAFAAADWSVVPAGRRPDPGRGFCHVDLAEPETLARVLDESDLVVNVVPDDALVAERMVLDGGGLLINVSAMPESSVRRLRGDGPQAHGTVLMNAGVAPGLTNLIAAELLAEHSDADEVELVFTVSTRGSIGPAGGGFAHRGLTRTGRHHTAVFPLPEPYGRRRCLGFAEAEQGWLDKTLLDGRTVSSYVCVAERARRRGLLAMNAAGLIAHLPRSAFAAGLDTPSAEPIAHWVAVRRHGQRIAARTLRCRGDYRAAAACTVLFGQALVSRAGHLPTGVLVPEQTLSIDDIQTGLDHAAIRIVDEPLSTATPRRARAAGRAPAAAAGPPPSTA